MIQSYFQAKFYDSKVSYLRQSQRRKSRSFVQAFLKMHYVLFDAGNLSITDIDGSGVTVSASANQTERLLNATGSGRGGACFGFNYNTSTTGALASTESGIVVGTGTTAVTPTDYQLATRIADGITSGTLEYFPCGGTTLSIAGSTGSFTLERLYRNSSGGSITVNEVGVYAMRAGQSNTSVTAFCVIRDLVSPGFAVANGEYMRIIYTISVTA